MKIVLNPDREIVEIAKQQLKENDNYCPCSLIKNEDTKCMCLNFRNMIKQGKECECHCGLYLLTDETIQNN